MQNAARISSPWRAHCALGNRRPRPDALCHRAPPVSNRPAGSSGWRALARCLAVVTTALYTLAQGVAAFVEVVLQGGAARSQARVQCVARYRTRLTVRIVGTGGACGLEFIVAIAPALDQRGASGGQAMDIPAAAAGQARRLADERTGARAFASFRFTFARGRLV